jgi:hypothetical protein
LPHKNYPAKLKGWSGCDLHYHRKLIAGIPYNCTHARFFSSEEPRNAY